MSDAEERWQRANLGLACFALDPAALGGIWLRARVGPVRDRFMRGFNLAVRGKEVARLHPGINDDALFGGVDLAATLASGQVTRTPGLLERANILVLPMAERATTRLAARLAGALDKQRKLALLALDEGAGPEERIPEALADRLAIHLDLSDVPLSDAPDLQLDTDALVEARRLLPHVTAPESTVSDLATVAFQLGITSLRAPLQALALARTCAALSGETEVSEHEVLTAVELVLAPRATRMPETAEDTPQEPEAPPPDDTPDDGEDTPDPDDNVLKLPAEMMLEAARAMLPADLLTRMEAGRAARNAAAAAGSGASKKGNRRGRPLPSRAGRLDADTRVDLVATLRSAAPWQPLRRRATGQDDRLHVRMSDIRVRQYEERSDRTIIFVVDASGSAAIARLAEAKGAIELLLGEAYARRDHVALVAFRGDGADVLLPPTRSLVQTKRRLGQLPGGGGTPLAAGLKTALELAGLTHSKGMTPSIVLLTDGRANVDLGGIADRAQAAEDAKQMARAIRAKGLSGLVIDTGQRPTRGLDALAHEMRLPYLPLPRADAKAVSSAVDAALDPGRVGA